MEDEKKKTVNLYDLLGIKKTANKKEIKAAFKRRAKQTHPDKEGGNEEDFKVVSEAYEILSDVTRKEQYDNTGDTQEILTDDRIVDFIYDELLPPIISRTESFEFDLLGEMRRFVNGLIGEEKLAEHNAQIGITNINTVLIKIKLNDAGHDDLFTNGLQDHRDDLLSKKKYAKKEQDFYVRVLAVIDLYSYQFKSGNSGYRNPSDTADNRNVKTGNLGYGN
jgi:curved DNA-binding protein CbpA